MSLWLSKSQELTQELVYEACLTREKAIQIPKLLLTPNAEISAIYVDLGLGCDHDLGGIRSSRRDPCLILLCHGVVVVLKLQPVI